MISPVLPERTGDLFDGRLFRAAPLAVTWRLAAQYLGPASDEELRIYTDPYSPAALALARNFGCDCCHVADLALAFLYARGLLDELPWLPVPGKAAP